MRRGPGGLGHHIIDPRTWRSAEGPWRTASVTAATCVDANTASTAAIILGADAPDWLDEQGLAARLVAYDGAVVTVGGWRRGPGHAGADRRGAGVAMIQWYAIRGVGAMTLILFSLTTAMGLLNRSRLATDRWPRFVIDRVHRNVALLAVVFLAIHIVLALTDGFVVLPLLAVFMPFSHSYSPLWIGLGSVACDLLLAIVITSLLRGRLGFRSWRAVHWLAYLSWPVAVAHGIGNGTDHFTVWMLAIDAACVATVLGALAVRVLSVPALAGVERLEATAVLERV